MRTEELMVDDTIEIRKPVRCVHELQNILKDCGIEKGIEL